MSERKQEESLLSTWTSAQQKVLAGWLDLMQQTQRPSRTVAWNETVKVWQTAVQETLDAQARWLRAWAERVQVTSGSPTDGRTGSISSSSLGHCSKLVPRLMSSCSLACEQADRPSSMRKRSGCGAGRPTCLAVKADLRRVPGEYMLFCLRLL